MTSEADMEASRILTLDLCRIQGCGHLAEGEIEILLPEHWDPRHRFIDEARQQKVRLCQTHIEMLR